MRKRHPLPSPEQLYKDHQKLIRKIADSFAHTTPIDVSDYLSLADEVFVRCMRKWDPARGMFSTLLWRALTNAFASLSKSEARRAAIVRLDNTVDSPTINHYGRLWLSDFMDGLRADAREIIRVLLTEDLPGTVSDAGRYVKAAIRRNLTGRARRAPAHSIIARFTSRRVNDAFSEIENAIKEVDNENV